MLMRRATDGSLLAASGAVAALEFALIAPVAGIMLLATFNISRAIVLWEEVQNTAHLIAVSATTVSDINITQNPNTPRATTLSDAEIQQSLSIIYAEMPWLANGAEKGRRSATLTSIGFLPASPASNCQVTPSQNCYVPYVAFSVPYAGGSLPGAVYFDKTVMRTCSTAITQITPGAALQAKQTWLNTLRTAAVTQPDAIIVADVHYVFTPYLPPLIAGMFPVNFDFYATNMWPARIGDFNTPPGQQYTAMAPGSSSGTGACPAPAANNS